jgi:peptide chain release factor 3
VRWVEAHQAGELDQFIAANRSGMARDLDGAPVFMAPSLFQLNYEQERWKGLSFSDVKDYQKVLQPA